MSVTEVTTAAGWIAGLAILALIASGWRKPARASADPARARHPSRRRAPLALAEVPAEVARPTPLWRRLFALVTSSVMAVVLGMAVATVVGYGSAWAVIKLTELLRR